jgi:hypothetical protein
MNELTQHLYSMIIGPVEEALWHQVEPEGRWRYINPSPETLNPYWDVKGHTGHVVGDEVGELVCDSVYDALFPVMQLASGDYEPTREVVAVVTGNIIVPKPRTAFRLHGIAGV